MIAGAVYEDRPYSSRHCSVSRLQVTRTSWVKLTGSLPFWESPKRTGKVIVFENGSTAMVLSKELSNSSGFM